ncbi:hypothetical protein N2152v2_007560 [Parachlorella kessleri]
MEDAFIEERLAAAMALSPSQRSPEVAAFIEACQLQQAVARAEQGRRSTRKQQALDDLKLIRSNFLSIVPLCYRLGVQLAALGRLCSEATIKDINSVGSAGSRVMELLNADFSIETVLLVAAGVSPLGMGTSRITRLLPVNNRVVERMQRPAVAARLRQELEQLQADLPRSLLSYEQLLAYFVMLGFQHVRDLEISGDKSMADDVDMASRAAAQLLPTLAPDQLYLQFCAITMAENYYSTVRIVSNVKQIRELLERAQQQDSDFVVGYCGYVLVERSADYGSYAWRVAKAPAQAWGSLAGLDAGERVAPPSLV